MGTLIAVIVVAVVLAGAAAAIALRAKRTPTPSVAPSEPARDPIDPPAPMTDLESALSRVTDSDGRPIRERIDAEAVHVDPLRDPDDTGPLLRRALDSVAHHDDDPPASDEQPGGV